MYNERTGDKKGATDLHETWKLIRNNIYSKSIHFPQAYGKFNIKDF